MPSQWQSCTPVTGVIKMNLFTFEIETMRNNIYLLPKQLCTTTLESSSKHALPHLYVYISILIIYSATKYFFCFCKQIIRWNWITHGLISCPVPPLACGGRPPMTLWNEQRSKGERERERESDWEESVNERRQSVEVHGDRWLGWGGVGVWGVAAKGLNSANVVWCDRIS